MKYYGSDQDPRLSSTAISRGLIEATIRTAVSLTAIASSTAISRGLIEASLRKIFLAVRTLVIHGDQPWPH